MTTADVKKHCPNCQRDLPKTKRWWHTLKRSKDGLQRLCKECRSKNAHARYVKNKDFDNWTDGKCRICLEVKSINAFSRRHDTGRRQTACRACLNEACRRWHFLHKDENNANKRTRSRSFNWALRCLVMNAYGGKCACCGETSFYFLQIDHISGGGRTHRKQVSWDHGGGPFYRWIVKNNFPDGFRCLCANCNQARGQWGFCPHDESTRQMVLLNIPTDSSLISAD